MKKQPTTKTKTYGIYSVLEEWQPNGLWAGFRCSVLQSSTEQALGKLYLQKDGRDHYREKPVDDNSDKDLEI